MNDHGLLVAAKKPTRHHVTNCRLDPDFAPVSPTSFSVPGPTGHVVVMSPWAPLGGDGSSDFLCFGNNIDHFRGAGGDAVARPSLELSQQSGTRLLWLLRVRTPHLPFRPGWAWGGGAQRRGAPSARPVEGTCCQHDSSPLTLTLTTWPRWGSLGFTFIFPKGTHFIVRAPADSPAWGPSVRSRVS